MPVCGPAKISCYNNAEDQLLLKEFNQGFEVSGENVRGQTECNCLPACTSIAYEAEISQADFDYKLLSNNLKKDEDADIMEGYVRTQTIAIMFINK